jgi:FixJ family two-component response regulator
MTNKKIAMLLAISEATVKTHVNSLLSKLGVADRTQAVTAAIQRGIITLDSRETEHWAMNHPTPECFEGR